MPEYLDLMLDYRIQPDQTWTYPLVPFEVLPGVRRIEVAYTYDSAISSDPSVTGGNTIDIGIFDARGAQWMSPGFRGWSGSARQSFYIAERDATPGYMPGPIQAGIWHICLGAYKIAPESCQCQIKIRMITGDHAESADRVAVFPARLPLHTGSRRAANADGWYKGELHCHTIHSDGDSTPEEVIAIAEALGLDFLAITDHNVQSHQVALNQIDTNLILIPGCEVTSYYGHWNIWGSGDWIDFRVQSSDDMRNAVQTANAQGYLTSLNHPKPYGPDWAFPAVNDSVCVETWNGPWLFLNDMSRTFWEDRLKTGQQAVAVGGSDFHHSHEESLAKLGTPTVYIHCPEAPSAANLLKHLRAGHAFVSGSPTGPRLDLRIDSAMMGDRYTVSELTTATLIVHDGQANPQPLEAQFCTSAGIIAHFQITESPQSFTIPIDPSARHYVRAQVVETGTIHAHCHALTNPIYFSE